MDQAAPRIRIFRPGSFTSVEGVAVSFTEADLAATAAAYDAEADPAPLVIGHPQLDDPAWGWVDRLTVEDGALVAVPSQVDPAFAETIRAGRYRKVSARFYAPDAVSNPKPGTWYLKHVGFLGAAAPAVKGLGTVAFAEDAAGVVTIDAPKFSTERKDKVVSEKSEVSFAEREAALNSREKALSDREAALDKAAKETRHAAHVSFAEGLIGAAKLAPAAKPLVVGLLDRLDTHEAVGFAEAGELTPAAAFRRLLEGAGTLIDLGEAGKKRGEKPAVVSFAAPDGYTVDAADAALYEQARAIQAEKPDLAWMECVRRAQAL